MGTSRALTIYLLKGDSADADYFVKLEHKLNSYRITLEPDLDSFLFVKQNKPLPPRWAPFFTPQLPLKALGLVNTASAALLVCASNRWWAITFGHGRHLLRDNVVEEGFGLRVALNAIGNENIRSLDKETFDMIAGHARQQASKEVETKEFGIDIERDLLNAVTGTPRDALLGQRLSGRDALWASISLRIENLPTYLARIF